MKQARSGSIDVLKGENLTKRYRARWYEPQPDGTTQQRSLCFGTYDEAVIHLSRVSAVQRRRKESLLEEEQKAPGRLRDLIALHCDWLSSRGCTKVTVRNTHASLSWMLDKDKIQKPITWVHEITFSVLLEFVRRNWQKNADRGRQRLAQIKTFLTQCDLLDYRINAGALKLKAKKHLGEPEDPKRKGAWSEEDLRKIMTELTRPCPDKSELTDGKRTENGLRLQERIYHRNRVALAPAFLLLVRYAMRPVTLCRLNVGDWDPQRAQIRLRPSVVKNKTGQVVPVDTFMAQVIERCAHNKSADAPLFSAPKSDEIEVRRWTREFLSLCMWHVLRRAGVDGTLYWAKHTACSYLIRQYQGDLALVAKYTGHLDLRQLQEYNLVPEDRSRVISRGYEALNQVADPASGIGIARFLEQQQPKPEAAADDDDDDSTAIGAVAS